jgi:hypothetical protein
MSTMTLRTDPYEIEQGSNSTLPWDIEFSAHLGGGESLSTPSATLEDLRDGTFPSGKVQSATVVGTKVRVTLTALTRGATYRLVTKATITADKTPTTETLVRVPH